MSTERHPEDYCHECGADYPRWWSPEWPVVTGTHGGITCPRCFMLQEPETFWVVTRWERQDPDADLAAFMRAVSGLDDAEADRVSRCVGDYFRAKELKL